MLLVSE